MNLDADRYRLFREFELLRDHWQRTRRLWHDSVRDEFDKEHWAALEGAVLTTLGAMDRLAPIVNQMQQECAAREVI